MRRLLIVFDHCVAVVTRILSPAYDQRFKYGASAAAHTFRDRSCLSAWVDWWAVFLNSFCDAGGGPCGLAAAMYLSNMGWRDIEVWDKLAHPRPSNDGVWGTGDRSYNIGISARGKAALRELGVYDRVLECCAPIMFRQEWSPQNPEGKRSSELGPQKQEPTQVTLLCVCCSLAHPFLLSVRSLMHIQSSVWPVLLGPSKHKRTEICMSSIMLHVPDVREYVVCCV